VIATDRSARLVIAGTGACLLLAYVTAMLLFPKPSGRIVVGDAVHHFVQLRSAVFDQDLHFQNEYARIYGVDGHESGTEWIFRNLTTTGHVRNYMPVGPALLWAPAYLAAAAVQSLLTRIGMAPAPTGYETALMLVPGVMGVLLATGGALISYRIARGHTAPAIALLAVLALWLGSHAMYYSLVSPAYSHSASMFAGSLFVWRWLVTRDAPSDSRAAEWGALAGLAALIRWQDAIFLLGPAVDLLRWAVPWPRRLRALAVSGLLWLAVFSPQMIVWTVLYGQPLAIPQGPAFMQWTSPHPWAVLFSDNHGLLTWAPIVVLSLAGLGRYLIETPGARRPVLVVLIVSWYVNAAVADWWAGEAFGARRFLSLFPFFVLGAALWIDRSRSTVRIALVASLAGLNWLLLLQYQLFMKGLVDLSPYPHGWIDMFLTRFLVPFRVIAHWLS
jgi:hypothetical protein